MIRRTGLTLLELVVVLGILAALATIVVVLVNQHGEDARDIVTRNNLKSIREVILNGYGPDMIKPSGLTENPKKYSLPRPWDPAGTSRPDTPQLVYLYMNPTTETNEQTFDLLTKGWRGPYLLATDGKYQNNPTNNFTSDYGKDGDSAPLDGWGHPIILRETISGSVTSAELRSAGPDGILLTTDDLVLPLY